MTRVTVTAEEAAFIRERVARFAEESLEGPRIAHASAVAKHQALPLYFGWTETLAIREDGTVVRWRDDEWLGAAGREAQEFDDRTWVNLALVQGAIRYPQLARLVPTRPSYAESCSTCGGTGSVPGLPEPFKHMICRCGGTGWLPSRIG